MFIKTWEVSFLVKDTENRRLLRGILRIPCASYMMSAKISVEIPSAVTAEARWQLTRAIAHWASAHRPAGEESERTTKLSLCAPFMFVSDAAGDVSVEDSLSASAATRADFREAWDGPRYVADDNYVLADSAVAAAGVLANEQAVDVEGGGGRRPRCFNCGEPGHQSRECPEPHDGRRIAAARRAMQEETGGDVRGVRFFADYGRTSGGGCDMLTPAHPGALNVVPGKLSSALLTAMGAVVPPAPTSDLHAVSGSADAATATALTASADPADSNGGLGVAHAGRESLGVADKRTIPIDAVANPLHARMRRFGPPPAYCAAATVLGGSVPSMHDLKCHRGYAANGGLSAIVASFDGPCSGAAAAATSSSCTCAAGSAAVAADSAAATRGSDSAACASCRDGALGRTAKPSLFHHSSTRETLRLTPMFPIPAGFSQPDA